ncbi:MAG TPA: CDP-alcohol phosphatidyltransferase family protein, partial [Candidatus Dormibacteraeota bacterium]|nr:CDP-alcohol phosphatidyltransferase family protein [Candidatus Dormibacteraeota bacterium]
FFESSSKLFHRAGLSPNSLTVVGFLLSVIAATLYWGGLTGWEWVAAIFVLLIGSFFDAVDGAMARKYSKVSKFGGVLDSVLDRIAEISLYAGLLAGALVQPWIGIWALSAALMVSYVRARVSAEGVTLKGVGIAERPERLLILIVATLLWPLSSAILGAGVLLIAVLSTVTVVSRVYRASRVLARA